MKSIIDLSKITQVAVICKDVEVEDGNGTVAKANQPVIESIKVIE